MSHLKYLLMLPLVFVINVAQAEIAQGNEVRLNPMVTANSDLSPEYILRVASDDPNVPTEIAYIVQSTSDDGFTSPVQTAPVMTPHEASWKKIHTINFWVHSSSGQKINVQLIKKSKNKEEIVTSGNGLFVMLHANKMGECYSTADGG